MFEDVLGRLRDELATTTGIETAADAAAAPAKARAALLRVQIDITQYDVLIRAAGLVRSAGPGPQRDTANEFVLLRNIDQVWPRRERVGPFARPRPWGDGVDGLRWLLSHGADVWMPTPAEQDAGYDEVYAAAEQQVARHDSELAAFRVLGTAGAA